MRQFSPGAASVSYDDSVAIPGDGEVNYCNPIVIVFYTFDMNWIVMCGLYRMYSCANLMVL